MITRKINFGPPQLRLEGILGLPEGKSPLPAIIVCHPHPLYGGNMYNSVVESICTHAGDHGLAWLKFNFRGVGRSAGNFAGGIGEKEDARAAISFMAGEEMIDPERIGLCGYSFGSLVALKVACEESRIKAVAAISPFLEPPSLLDHYEKPKLFVCGTEDEFIDVPKLRELVARLPEPKELILFPGTNHFWNLNENRMAQQVSAFFKKYL